MYHGILNVYKEKGYTSFDVVAKLRGICGQRKIGHTGTLDPDAEGVLPVCLGNAAKVCDLLTGREKEYRVRMLLGVETDTQDMSGTVLARRETGSLSPEWIREVCSRHVGAQLQIPPMYSALKINGQKLCDLARKGEVVERTPRPVTIYELEIEEISIPEVCLRVRCSKGTYIRTLCHDIGGELGCGAAVRDLLRTEAAGWRLEDARTLSEIETLQSQGLLETVLVPVENVFSDLPARQTLPAADKKLQNGNALRSSEIVQEQGTCVHRRNSAQNRWETGCPQEENIVTDSLPRVRMYDSAGHFLAVYCFDESGSCYLPVKMFL